MKMKLCPGLIILIASDKVAQEAPECRLAGVCRRKCSGPTGRRFPFKRTEVCANVSGEVPAGTDCAPVTL